MNDMHNFLKAKTTAINELHEMQKRAVKSTDTSSQNTAKIPINKNKNMSNFLSLPMSNDDIVILGLILILSKDCHDKWLFWALLYILM